MKELKESEGSAKDHIDFPIEWDEASYRVVSKVRRTSAEKIGRGIRPYFLGFNEVEIRSRVEHPPHWHSSYELIVVEVGPYTCKLNHELIELDAASCLLIKPGDLHEVMCESGQRHYVLQFELEDRALAQAGGIGIFHRNILPADQSFRMPQEEVLPTLETIGRQFQKPYRFSSEIQDSLIEYLFWIMLSHLPKEHLAQGFLKKSEDHKFLVRLARFEEEYHSTQLSLEKLARLMGISKSTLSKRCSELLGQSPGQYINHQKISRAITLLQATRKPIKEVSYEVGFQNPFHFSRVFKRVTGSTPSDFRSTCNHAV